MMQLFDIVCDLDISAKASSMLDTVSYYVKIVMMFTEDPIRTNAACIVVACPNMVERIQHVFGEMGHHPNTTHLN